jgi:hypothetical protein
MRDLFKTVLTGSMVAGAALLVAACGGGESTEANNTSANFADETLMGNTGDVTAVDALNGTDANLGAGMDANMGATTDMNATSTTTNTTTTTGTDANMTAGNTTGM